MPILADARPQARARVAGSPATPDFRHAGACLEDPDLFFGPDREREPARKLREAEAVIVCWGCSVRGECLSWALARPDLSQFGVWGGYGEDELHELKGGISSRRRRAA